MEKQIIELEKRYWQGMESHDFETVKSLTHFPCIVASKKGVRSVDEATFKKMFDSGAGAKLKVKNITDTQTQTLGNSSVILAYLVELEKNDNEKKSSTKCACASTWVKENDHWLCALHTEAELT